MKLLKNLKEIFRANKWEYLVSIIVVTLGCTFLYFKDKIPLEYSIPSGLVGLTFFMFGFGLFLGDKE